MTDVRKILTDFTRIDGVHSVCLVGRDGYPLENIAQTENDGEMIGAIASTGFGSAEAMGSQLGQGKLSMTILEYSEGFVMFAPVGSSGTFLVLMTDPGTNLGWVRIAIKKNTPKLQWATAE